MLSASDKRAYLTLIICQLYSFVMDEQHILSPFVLQAVDMNVEIYDTKSVLKCNKVYAIMSLIVGLFCPKKLQIGYIQRNKVAQNTIRYINGIS